jgi:hypothetical protein
MYTVWSVCFSIQALICGISELSTVRLAQNKKILISFSLSISIILFLKALASITSIAVSYFEYMYNSCSICYIVPNCLKITNSFYLQFTVYLGILCEISFGKGLKEFGKNLTWNGKFENHQLTDLFFFFVHCSTMVPISKS